MVRFARAEGSKGSNKRQLEDPTPWSEMVEQIKTSKKKKKSLKETEKRISDDATEQTTKKKKQKIDAEDVKPHNTLEKVKKGIPEDGRSEPTQMTQDPAINKKKKKKGLKNAEPEYTITSEGKRVKVFKDGTERTWFDLPYEESDVMTRYESMWVKREMVADLDRLKAALEDEGLEKKEIMRKMMKAKRKAHRQLRIELIYQQKELVNEATGEKGEGSTHLKKSKEKNNNNGTTLTKKKKKKLKGVTKENDSLFSQNRVIDVESEEASESNEEEAENSMKGLVRKETIVKIKDDKSHNTIVDMKGSKSPKKSKLESYVSSLQNDAEGNGERDSDIKVTVTQLEDKVKQKKGKKKDKVKINETTSQNNKKETIKGEDEMRNAKEEKIYCQPEVLELPGMEQKDTSQGEEAEAFNSLSREDKIQGDSVCSTTGTSNSHWKFEENNLMTNYDGYWVLHEDVGVLEAAKKAELEALCADRTDETVSSAGELTKEQQLALQRFMKKRKRFHHRQLLKKLSSMGKKGNDSEKGKGNEKGNMRKNDKDKVVKFDGFWVKKEAADRLQKLRKRLYKEGLSQQEVDTLVQKERRKEERVLKNERRLVCLNCRQPGHMVSACPNIVQAEGEGQPSICYTCGSTEHTSSTCNLKKGSEKSFSFATCYICKESGHISRQCPDNPRGLYPKGGACRGCGSVEHLAKDCPDLQKEKGETNMRLGRLKGEELEALDAEEEKAASDEDEVHTHTQRSIPKVVKF